ncbi:hypothetical protein WN944_017314 [Citrus x changshan-huyou]|uniref:Uncharacterized protein n=1 Tax=Citrus x changshan-huyou TaxID=2935761 RepID=A0AAP0MB21_9ROSI
MANKSFDSGSGSTAAFNMMVPSVSMTLMLFSSGMYVGGCSDIGKEITYAQVNSLEESIDEALVVDEFPINPSTCQVHPIHKSWHPIELKRAPERHRLQGQVSSIAIFEDI